jgi:hypothetical protein
MPLKEGGAAFDDAMPLKEGGVAFADARGGTTAEPHVDRSDARALDKNLSPPPPPPPPLGTEGGDTLPLLLTALNTLPRCGTAGAVDAVDHSSSLIVLVID